MRLSQPEQQQQQQQPQRPHAGVAASLFRQPIAATSTPLPAELFSGLSFLLTGFDDPAERHRVGQDITVHGGLVVYSIPQPRVRACLLWACVAAYVLLEGEQTQAINDMTDASVLQMLDGQQLVLVARRPWKETVQEKSMLAAVAGCAVAKPEWVAACIQVWL